MTNGAELIRRELTVRLVRAFDGGRLEEEIDAVISTDPYRYRDILANPALVREKRETLEREIRDYRE